jgi:GT2 family glycosyltransferase
MKVESIEMPNSGTSPPQAGKAMPPPPADVEGNDWRALVPPDLGEWAPSATVSVVIPVYQAQQELELVLAVLAEQTYPSSLTQVVVVDDGSTPAIELGAAADGLQAELIYCERLDSCFGSGRARNLGASSAEGEILVFLDADMIPSPELVEAHARWHHLTSDAATLGGRQHIEPDGLRPEELREAASTGALGGLLQSRDPEAVEWIESFLKRTNDLTTPRLDLFRVFTGGNFALRADTYHAVGGIRELGVRGVEDTQLGYRLFNYGAILVPEPLAMAWHQGKSHFKGVGRDATRHVRGPVMANYIPVGGFRPTDTQRTFAVPFFRVELQVGEEPVGAIVEVVDALLTSYGDLEVRVPLSKDYPDRDFLVNAFTAEPRVEVLADQAPDAWTESPFLVKWSMAAVPGPHTFASISERMMEGARGALHVTVPGHAPTEGTIDVLGTGALSRAGRVASRNGGDTATTMGHLFGEQWISGLDLGIEGFSEGSWRSRQAAAAPSQASTGKGSANRRPAFAPLAPAAERGGPSTRPSTREEVLEQRLARAEQTIDALLRRRALRIATNAGRLVRRLDALGPRGLVRSIRQGDARGALLRAGFMLGVTAVLAAAAVAVWIAAASGEAALATAVGVLSAVVGAAIALWLGSSSTELRRLTHERARAQSTATGLERSLSQVKRSLEQLELRYKTLEEEKQTIQRSLSEQEQPVRTLWRDLAQTSQPLLKRLLSSWRRRAS